GARRLFDRGGGLARQSLPVLHADRDVDVLARRTGPQPSTAGRDRATASCRGDLMTSPRGRRRERGARPLLRRVTEKGQVTIPKELRDALGIGAGTEVAFERADDAIVVRKVEGGSNRGREMVNRLRGRGDVRLSTEEIMALTRQL
ncbi:MAG: AbrB/MazE/SpoVT family DNA-binding domain-containing protein, partial [Actinomycetota bacterium]|nr:AbrB/MazE/SpoVT family DNA-binding domain-containing protein [Actinomycetota bacterium]